MRVYLDHQATTPVDPRVLEAMLPWLSGRFGNPASVSHSFGWEARDAVDAARTVVARAIGAEAEEIVFTSGATESNNLALKGAAAHLRPRGNHIVTVATEHHAVLDVCTRLERDGFRVTRLPVAADGLVSSGVVGAALTEGTILLSVMLANNETGVLQPIAELGALAARQGVVFHCDATQGVGKIPVDVRALGVHLASFSGHKIYGPKGVGALYVRRRDPRIRIEPQLDGGGHERGLRSGTLNVPGIVGLARALELCMEAMPTEAARLAGLRDRLRLGLRAALDSTRENGNAEHRLPHCFNMTFDYADAESVLMALPDIALSPGAACSSAEPEPSHVLKAMGLSPDQARCSLRFGLGRWTTEAEIDHVLGRVVEVVTRLRKLSGLYPG